MAEQRVAVVVGVGPGLGGALARRFTAEGWRVAHVSRSAEGPDRYACDVTDEAAIRATFAAIRADLGPVHTVLWNVGSGIFGDIDEITVDALDLAFHTNARGLFVAMQAVLPDLRAQGGGNVIITGATASLRGKPFTTAFSAGKGAQRNLAQALARKLWPEGIHVATIVVDGMVDLPRTRASMPDRGDEAFVSPEGFADAALFLCQQDRRAWTFELDVRPHVESW